METISIGLTVYFEDGFWHGLFEQSYRESYQVCRVTFGQEPKDDEILEIIQTQFTQLSFSPEATVKQHVKIKNPKRLQRMVKKQVRKGKRFQNINLVSKSNCSNKRNSNANSKNEETSIKDINVFLFIETALF